MKWDKGVRLETVIFLSLSLSLLPEKMDIHLFEMSSSSNMTGIQDVFKMDVRPSEKLCKNHACNVLTDLKTRLQQ